MGNNKRATLPTRAETLSDTLPMSGTYTVARLLEDCANSPQNSNADEKVFSSVWQGLMQWMASNWMMSKGINVSPLGKFVFHVEELDLGNNTIQKAKVPSFIPNEEWLRNYGLKTKGQPPRRDDGLPVEMNFANIAQLAKQSKDTVQLCLKDIFLHIGQTIKEGHKVSLDWYIGRLTAEHGIISFTFFDSDALQKREKERATGKSILNSRAPDSSRGGSTARSHHRMLSQRSAKAPSSWGVDLRPAHDVDSGLSLGVSRPPTMSTYGGETDMIKQGRRSGKLSHRSRSSRPRTGASAYSQASGSCYSSEGGMDYTNTLSLIGAKNRPDPGAPQASTGYGSPTKAHVIQDSYGRYENDLKRRQESSNKLEQESSDRQRLQSQVEVLKSEQKRREQTEMKRMLAKQVVERQQKREEERREKLVPYDLTHVLPLERDRDFFQEYAEKQGMKRALFKQMEEKKAIKQRELDRERAMDLESKEALAVSLAKEHALNAYQQSSAGQMLRDNWSKQIRLKEIENCIDGDCYCPEPQGKRAV